MIWDYSGPGKILHERQAPPLIWSGRPQGAAASTPTSQEPLHLRTSCVPIACWTDFREETHPWMRPAVLTAQHRRQLLYPQRGWQGQGRKEPGPLPSDGSHTGATRLKDRGATQQVSCRSGSLTATPGSQSSARGSPTAALPGQRSLPSIPTDAVSHPAESRSRQQAVPTGLFVSSM